MAKNPKWTNEDLNLLKENYNSKTREDLEKMFPGRNFQAIQIKANRLGVHRLNYFTEKDIEFIRNNYENMTTVEMGKILGRNKTNVQQKAKEMGFFKQENWSDEENQRLIKNFEGNSVDELSEKFFKNRTKSAIYHQIQQLGLQNKTNRYESFSDDYFIEKMKFIYNKIGRVLMSRELCEFDMPSPQLFVTRFGSYSNFCKACGLEPNTGYIKHQKTLDKKGDICLSLSEKIISDFLFDNGFIYLKEIPYKKLIPSYLGKMRCDWLLNGNVVVEFFGMSRHKKYKTRMENKINLCSENNIKLIELYEQDLLNEKYKEKLNPFIK